MSHILKFPQRHSFCPELIEHHLLLKLFVSEPQQPKPYSVENAEEEPNSTEQTVFRCPVRGHKLCRQKEHTKRHKAEL